MEHLVKVVESDDARRYEQETQREGDHNAGFRLERHFDGPDEIHGRCQQRHLHHVGSQSVTKCMTPLSKGSQQIASTVLLSN